MDFEQPIWSLGDAFGGSTSSAWAVVGGQSGIEMRVVPVSVASTAGLPPTTRFGDATIAEPSLFGNRALPMDDQALRMESPVGVVFQLDDGTSFGSLSFDFLMPASLLLGVNGILVWYEVGDLVPPGVTVGGAHVTAIQTTGDVLHWTMTIEGGSLFSVLISGAELLLDNVCIDM